MPVRERKNAGSRGSTVSFLPFVEPVVDFSASVKECAVHDALAVRKKEMKPSSISSTSPQGKAANKKNAAKIVEDFQILDTKKLFRLDRSSRNPRFIGPPRSCGLVIFPWYPGQASAMKPSRSFAPGVTGNVPQRMWTAHSDVGNAGSYWKARETRAWGAFPVTRPRPGGLALPSGPR